MVAFEICLKIGLDVVLYAESRSCLFRLELIGISISYQVLEIRTTNGSITIISLIFMLVGKI